MTYLAIDTTNSILNVVLRKDDNLYHFEKKMEKTEHSSSLMPAIESIINEANVEIKDIDYFAVNVGPGSFTGIRIGVASMTALSYANNAKRVAYKTFELIALKRARCTVTVDAGHGNIYVANCKDGEILDTSFIEAGENVDLSSSFSDPLIETYLAIDEVVMKKISKNDLVSVFEPFYMRKSQAERNEK